jgi:acetylornithine deacetylase/succinyl-diaminopimelate desuccinylase-like protein
LDSNAGGTDDLPGDEAKPLVKYLYEAVVDDKNRACLPYVGGACRVGRLVDSPATVHYNRPDPAFAGRNSIGPAGAISDSTGPVAVPPGIVAKEVLVIDKVIAHVRSNHDAYLARLDEFLRIPCISTDPAAKPAMQQGAEWVLRFFTDCGIEAVIEKTDGHPAIIADTGPASGKGPTVLIYGHYDVQPTGDLGLWKSGPFEPVIRDGRIYARGSADDKGQVLTHMLAAEAWKKVAGQLPIRVKFLIEGEEEIGSPSLGKLIAAQARRLACDYVCLSDTAKFSADIPAITYGTKGLVYKEVTFTGAKNDLHSGTFGGSIPNPGNALANLLTKMKDANNRVMIPGFYDDVLPNSEHELATLRKLPFDEKAYLDSLGAGAADGEKGFTTMERRWLRPTLDVNGLLCGFTGDGAMTIVPAKAMAKVSMRLVPNQSPEKISAAFDQFVAANVPAGLKHQVKDFTSCGPYMCPLDSPAMKKAAAAVEAGFGVAPAFIREGGSLPILPTFKKLLGADSILMGFCLSTCNAHGPNEFMVVEDFRKGIATGAHLIAKMAG